MKIILIKIIRFYQKYLSALKGRATCIYPPFEKGLQRRIRHAANNPPFNTPYFSIASIAYCEQVGVYIQVALPLRADRYF